MACQLSPEKHAPADPGGHPPVPYPTRRMIFLAGVVIILAVLVGYCNSFSGPFIFDDQGAITENPTIRHLWPISSALSPPKDGSPVTGRPVTNFSFAANYALEGTKVQGYHALNLVIHIFAGLTLFGIVRRTLRQPAMRPRYGQVALPLAFAVALLWAVHPLLTASVTYVAQRAESLMGLFYLLTLYCFVRGVDSRVPVIWYSLAVTACLLGMGSKEVMISAPLIVLLYDRSFITGSFREAWKQHWHVYLGLAVTWLPLGYLMAGAGNRGSSVGFDTEVAWPTYALTQFRAIAHYLRLSVWPYPLVFDYGRGILVKDVVAVAPYALLLVLLVGGTVVALRRWPPVGFLGCWFFFILAPTSSVVPVATELVAEHRMYLPLAAVVTLGVVLIHALAGRRSLTIFLIFMVGLVILTLRRNENYRSGWDIWSDTVAKCPDNARAHNNFGNALFQNGRIDEALEQYEEAVKIQPNYAFAYNSIGWALLQKGQRDEAIAQFQKALEIQPDYAKAHNNLALALLQKGQVDEAIVHYQKALEIQPYDVKAQNNLGNILLQRGRVDEALAHFQEAMKLEPNDPQAQNNLGVAFLRKGQVREAIVHFRKALEIQPNYVMVLRNLAWIQATCPEASVRDGAKAVELAQQADQLSGGRNPAIIGTLAAAYAEAGRFPEAVATAQEALRLADAQTNTAMVNALQTQIGFYEADTPFRDINLTNALSSESKP